MADEPEEKRTIKEKLLFYTTAFFILLGTFSLFAFLFLVPFVIDPAFSTIFMQFDTTPVNCITVEVIKNNGTKFCNWTSCREGCTKELFKCLQIYVNYKYNAINQTINITEIIQLEDQNDQNDPNERKERALRDYDYLDSSVGDLTMAKISDDDPNGGKEYSDIISTNEAEWDFVGARLKPNVKGCGYPPYLNCSIWEKKYQKIGTNFSCYYSKVDPSIVMTDLDMWQNTLNLIYAIGVPVPSFIISVIYLIFAYFKIYNEDEETVPLDKNAEDIAGDDVVPDDENESGVIMENGGINETTTTLPNGTTPLSVSGPITSNSDIASFGHQLKVQMADEMSRESIDGGLISNSGSIQGNLSKTMTTSISTPPGPIAAV